MGSAERGGDHVAVKRRTQVPGTEASPVTAGTKGVKRASEATVTLAVDQKGAAAWKKWWVRVSYSWLLVFGFLFIIALGHVALSLCVIGLQFKAFQELISISYRISYEKQLPWHRTLNWYFVIVTNFFLYFRTISSRQLYVYHETLTIVSFFKTYHMFISYAAYLLGLVLFVLSLKKGLYKYQFKQFAWTHLAIIVVCFQAQMIIESIFNGIYFLVVPAGLVIGNDCMAYICGFFFGRTPLISLSPKKTWEGFIGAAIFTMMLSVVLSWAFAQSDYFVCPKINMVNKMPTVADFTTIDTCETPYHFRLRDYTVPESLRFKSLHVPDTFRAMPCQLHALVFGLFASFIAPFGGFFASGFKRAYNIKDFGNVIPGHGGILDRFDCHFVMGAFVFIYTWTVIALNPKSPADILREIQNMSPELQREVYKGLTQMVSHTATAIP